MIYSIVPPEQLFYADIKQERMEVSINGEKVILLKNDDNTYTVERLISTNPKAYLKPEFMPGRRLLSVTPDKGTPDAKWEVISNGIVVNRI